MKNEWWNSEYGGLKIPFSVFHSVTVMETVLPKSIGKYLSLGHMIYVIFLSTKWIIVNTISIILQNRVSSYK